MDTQPIVAGAALPPVATGERQHGKARPGSPGSMVWGPGCSPSSGSSDAAVGGFWPYVDHTTQRKLILSHCVHSLNRSHANIFWNILWRSLFEVGRGTFFWIGRAMEGDDCRRRARRCLVHARSVVDPAAKAQMIDLAA